MRKQKRARIITIALIVICVLLILSAPFIFMGANLARDWYRESMVSIPCINLLDMGPHEGGGIIVVSSLCTETTNTYTQVTTWYNERGWSCDGNCEMISRNLDFGPLHIENDWSNMQPVQNDSYRNPLQIRLVEEYLIYLR